MFLGRALSRLVMIRFIRYAIIFISFLPDHVTVQEDFLGEGSEA
jgi:hypothetical protein